MDVTRRHTDALTQPPLRERGHAGFSWRRGRDRKAAWPPGSGCRARQSHRCGCGASHNRYCTWAPAFGGWRLLTGPATQPWFATSGVAVPLAVQRNAIFMRALTDQPLTSRGRNPDAANKRMSGRCCRERGRPLSPGCVPSSSTSMDHSPMGPPARTFRD